jgi:hypothetical protein
VRKRSGEFVLYKFNVKKRTLEKSLYLYKAIIPEIQTYVKIVLHESLGLLKVDLLTTSVTN